MNRWKLIEHGYNNRSTVFSCSYGEHRADIDIVQLFDSLEFGVTWTIVYFPNHDYMRSRILYQQRELVDMYSIYSKIKILPHHEIHIEHVVKIIEPFIDKAQMMLFCCVAEKLI